MDTGGIGTCMVAAQMSGLGTALPRWFIFVDDHCPVVVCGEGLLKLTSLMADDTRESLLPLKRFRTRFG